MALYTSSMQHMLTLKRVLDFPEIESILRKVKFRGLYNQSGENLNPYRKARFTLTTVYPPKGMGHMPQIKDNGKREILFSPQPTIYQNQTGIMKILDEFLCSEGYRLTELKKAIEYEWDGRGEFHVLPPIVEKHSYDLRGGFVDLDKLSGRFRNTFVRDAAGNLHEVSKRYLTSFHIDEVSKLPYLDIFHSNAPLINYGLSYNGPTDFYIVCDGMHRIDFAIEVLNKPITVILVDMPSKKDKLMPYYAFPVPFRPTIRLSSKRSEIMFPRLERDKIHLFNDFLKKVLHYDWSGGGLNVSSLRNKAEIY